VKINNLRKGEKKMKKIGSKVILAVMVMILGIGVAGVANAATITYYPTGLYTDTLGAGTTENFSFLVDITDPPYTFNTAVLRIEATRVNSGTNEVFGQLMFLNFLNEGTGNHYDSATEFPIASLFTDWSGGNFDVSVVTTESLKLTSATLFVNYTLTSTVGGPNNGSSAVPEAGTIILLGSGLVGLVGYRRSRRMV
jgi:hypothetical protein